LSRALVEVDQCAGRLTQTPPPRRRPTARASSLERL